MCPLVAAPNRGYNDWQRVNNYDTGILWSIAPVNQPGNEISPVIDVSRYARSCIQASLSGAGVVLVVQWFADSAGTVVIGERDIVLASGWPTAQLALVNMGPFVKFAVEPFGGGNISGNVNMFASNRDFPSEMVPRQDLLIDAQQLTLPASGNVHLIPVDYYAGPALLLISCTVTFSVGVYAVSQGNTLDQIFATNNLVASTNTWEVNVPCQSFEVILFNATAGSGTYDAALTASHTGGM